MARQMEKSFGKGKMFRQEWELELCALFGNRNCTPQGEWRKERKFILFTKNVLFYAHAGDIRLGPKVTITHERKNIQLDFLKRRCTIKTMYQKPKI